VLYLTHLTHRRPGETPSQSGYCRGGNTVDNCQEWRQVKKI